MDFHLIDHDPYKNSLSHDHEMFNDVEKTFRYNTIQRFWYSDMEGKIIRVSDLKPNVLLKLSSSLNIRLSTYDFTVDLFVTSYIYIMCGLNIKF